MTSSERNPGTFKMPIRRLPKHPRKHQPEVTEGHEEASTLIMAHPREEAARQPPGLVEDIRSTWCQELSAVKAEICDKIDKIDALIEEVNADLKGEIDRLETDISHKLEPILATSQKQSEAIRELETTAALNDETTHRLTAEVERISGLLAKVTEKCLDLEGRSKCQNLRIVGVKEGKELG